MRQGEARQKVLASAGAAVSLVAAPALKGGRNACIVTISGVTVAKLLQTPPPLSRAITRYHPA